MVGIRRGVRDTGVDREAGVSMDVSVSVSSERSRLAVPRTMPSESLSSSGLPSI